MKIAILNGPNLNLLGHREPTIYGTKSMEQVLVELQRLYPDLHMLYKQSNHEGDLIDWIQNYSYPELTESHCGLDAGEPVSAVIINAGGYTHTSVSLRDAIAACTIPVIEVHISDISQREPFRRVSLLTDVCAYTIMGQGTDGYRLAVEYILNRNNSKAKE